MPTVEEHRIDEDAVHDGVESGPRGDDPPREEAAVPWSNVSPLHSMAYICGYCGNRVASANGFQAAEPPQRALYICPHCDNPTYFMVGLQSPQVPPGNEVAHLPPDIEALYREVRQAVAGNAPTGSVLLARKLLMHLAVTQGAQEGKSFVSYVEFLATKGYVPPNGQGWVDHIRRKGNEANHEIALMTQDDAEELISFLEMLLKFMYEFPARMPPPPAS